MRFSGFIFTFIYFFCFFLLMLLLQLLLLLWLVSWWSKLALLSFFFVLAFSFVFFFYPIFRICFACHFISVYTTHKKKEDMPMLAGWQLLHFSVFDLFRYFNALISPICETSVMRSNGKKKTIGGTPQTHSFFPNCTLLQKNNNK